MIDAGFGNRSISIEQRRYLGSKTKLLSFISDILDKEGVAFGTFADIFAGTGLLANYFHEKAEIIVNDILESNYQAYRAFFGSEQLRLSYLKIRLQKYNKLDCHKIEDNYFSETFANTYFDEENSRRIGFIRDDIESLFLRKKINARERAYLVTALIYALDRIANTVGHYDAYRKIKMPTKILELRPLEIKKRKHRSVIYKKNANELATHIKADVVYIEPPY